MFLRPGWKSPKGRLRRIAPESLPQVDLSLERLVTTSSSSVSHGNRYPSPSNFPSPEEEVSEVFMGQKTSELSGKNFGSFKKMPSHRPKWFQSGVEGGSYEVSQKWVSVLPNTMVLKERHFSQEPPNNKVEKAQTFDSDLLPPYSPFSTYFKSTAPSSFQCPKSVKEILVVDPFVNSSVSQTPLREVSESLLEAGRINNQMNDEFDHQMSRYAASDVLSGVKYHKIGLNNFINTLYRVWRFVCNSPLKLKIFSRKLFACTDHHGDPEKASWVSVLPNADEDLPLVSEDEKNVTSVTCSSFYTTRDRVPRASPINALKLLRREYCSSETSSENPTAIRDSIEENTYFSMGMNELSIEVCESEVLVLKSGGKEIERSSAEDQKAPSVISNKNSFVEVEKKESIYSRIIAATEGSVTCNAADFAAISASASAPASGVEDSFSSYAGYNGTMDSKLTVNPGAHVTSSPSGFLKDQVSKDPREDFEASRIIASIIGAQISRRVLGKGACDSSDFATTQNAIAESANRSLPHVNETSEGNSESHVHDLPAKEIFSPTGIVYHAYNPCTKIRNSWADFDSDDDYIFEEFFASHGQACPPKEKLGNDFSNSPVIESSSPCHITATVDDPICLNFEHTDEEAITKDAEITDEICNNELEARSVTKSDETPEKFLLPSSGSFLAPEGKTISLDDLFNSVTPSTPSRAIQEQTKGNGDSPDSFITPDFLSAINIDIDIDDEIEDIKKAVFSSISSPETNFEGNNVEEEGNIEGCYSKKIIEDLQEYQFSVDDLRWDVFTNRDAWRLTELFVQIFEENAAFSVKPRTKVVKVMVEQEGENVLAEESSSSLTTKPTESEIFSEFEALLLRIGKENSTKLSQSVREAAMKYRCQFLSILRDLVGPCIDQIKGLVHDIQSLRNSLWGLFSFGSGIDTELRSMLHAIEKVKDLDYLHLEKKLESWHVAITNLSPDLGALEHDLSIIKKNFNPRWKDISDSISRINIIKDQVLNDYELFCDAHEAVIGYSFADFQRYTGVNNFKNETQFLCHADLEYIQEFLEDDLKSLSKAKDPMDTMISMVRTGLKRIETKVGKPSSRLPANTDCDETIPQDEMDRNGTKAQTFQTLESQKKRKRNSASKSRRNKKTKQKH